MIFERFSKDENIFGTKKVARYVSYLLLLNDELQNM